MPCSLAIRRGLRRAELPADARERRRRTSKKGEGEGSRGKGRASYVSRRTYRRVKVGNRERERGGGWGIYAAHMRDTEWGGICIAAIPMGKKKMEDKGEKEDKGRRGIGQRGRGDGMRSRERTGGR